MTMANEQKLRVIIEAVDRASQTIKSISSRLAVELRQIGRRMLFIGGLVSGFTGLAVRAAETSQQAWLQLRTIVNAVEGSYEALEQRTIDTVTELDKLSKFTETDLVDALQVGAKATGDLDFALRALPAAVALASGAGLSVQEAMKLITGAINGDEGARKALADLGIDTGVLAGPDGQFALLTDVTKKYGDATAKANTATAQLSGHLRTIGKVIGDTILPFLDRVVPLVERAGAAIQAWAKAHPALAQALGMLLFILGPVLLFLGLFATALGNLIPILGFLLSPIGLVILALLALGVGLAILITNWDKGWAFIKDHATVTVAALAVIFSILVAAFGPIVIAMGLLIIAAFAMWRHWEKIWGFMKTAAQNFANDWIIKTNLILAATEMMVNGIIAAVNAAIRALNILNPFSDIPRIPDVTLPRIAPMHFANPSITPLMNSGSLPGGLATSASGVVNNFNLTLNAEGAVIGIDDLDHHILQLIRNAATGGGFNRLFEGR